MDLYLGKPYLRIWGPEGWQLHTDSCEGLSGGRSGRVFIHQDSCVPLAVRVTNVVCHDYMNDGNKFNFQYDNRKRERYKVAQKTEK